MAAKKENNGRRGASHANCEASGKVVLVGTYKGDQLTAWRGWYNYPISEDDLASMSAKHGRAGAPRTPKPHATHYALFKTERLYHHKLDVPQDADQVIIRLSDFAATLAANHPNTNVINDDIHSFKEAV